MYHYGKPILETFLKIERLVNSFPSNFLNLILFQLALSSAVPRCLILKAATSKLSFFLISKSHKSLIRLSSVGTCVILAKHLEDMCNTKYKNSMAR
jgi:hypothetical protein